MKINLRIITDKLEPAVNFWRRYYKIIFVIVLIGLYGFLIFRINVLSAAEPTVEQIDEVVKEVKRPRLDKEAVAKIQELEDQNIQVQTLFQEARNNPFSE